MYLKYINEIKEEGTTVFMPSGIQATIFNENGEVVVKYFNLSEDRYSKEEFDKLIEEGIFIFNDRPTTQVIEADENGENTLETFFGLKEDDFKTKADLIKAIEDNTDYDVVSSDNLTLNVKDRTDENGEETVINLKRQFKEAFNQADFKEGSVYKYVKEREQEYLTQEFKLELLQCLDKIAREFPNVEVRQSALGIMDEVGLQEYYDIPGTLDFVNKYLPILNRHVVESLEEEPFSEEYEFKIEKLNDKGDFRLIGNNGEVSDIYVPEGDTLKDNIRDYIDCELIYDMDNSENICSSELSSYEYDEKTGIGSFSATYFWDEELNESKKPISETFIEVKGNKIEINPSNTVKFLDEETYVLETPYIELGENEGAYCIRCTYYVDQNLFDFKVIFNDAPNGEDEIDINKANSYLSATDKEIIMNTIKEGMKLHNSLKENSNEEEKPFITLQGTKINLEEGSYKWLDKDTFYFQTPSVTDKDNDKCYYYLIVEWHEDEQRFIYEIIFEDEDGFTNSIDGDKHNQYLSQEDKAIVREYVQGLLKQSVTETLQEAGSGLENISNDLQDGKKEGYDPVEFGNWICSTSLDEKWNALTDGMKAFILNKIGIEVLAELEQEDLELNFDYNVLLNNDLDSNDLESLGVFDDLDILDMINGEDKINMYISYKIEHDNKIKDENETPVKSDKKKMHEEYGDYKGLLDEAADDLERGYTSGSGSNEDGDYTWHLTVNGEKLEDLLKTPEMRDWICYEVSYPVKDGHDAYGGLDTLFNNWSYTGQIDHTDEDVIADLITLGFDEGKVKDMAKAGNAKSGNIDDIIEIETWIDYDIHYEVEEREEWYIIDRNGDRESDYFDDKEDAEYECEQMNNDPDYEYGPYEVKSTLDESFKLKDKKKKKKKLDDSLNKEEKGMKKMNENAFKVYNSIENKECGTFNSWNEVESYLNQEWGSYSASMAKENPKFGTEEDKDNFFNNFTFDLIEVPVEVVIADAEVEETPVEEPIADEPEIVNQDIADAKDADYVEVAGVTADPEKAEVVDTLMFTPEEGEVINDLEPGEKALLPNEQPDAADEYANVGAATEIVKADMEDISGETDEIISTESNIDDYIASLLDDEDEVCPECGQEPCACEEEPDEDEKEEVTEEKCDSYIKDKWYKVQGYPLSLKFTGEVDEDGLLVFEKADGIKVHMLKDNRIELDETKNETFSDNMGMLTNVQDLDMPDALADTIDAKEDGTLYKLSDLAKEIAELKANFQKEIDDFKAELKDELKTALGDLKTDIKDDVKDIQTDVTSKLDNTDSRIADLTAEEEEIEGEEELDLENEEPSEPEEEPAEEEEEQVEESYNGLTEAEKSAISKQCIQNPMYEQIKEVIRGSKLPGKKISVMTIAEKLREDYGINTKVDMVMENVVTICEYTPVKKYIIDENEEKRLTKDENLGIAKNFLRKGLDTVWAATREAENMQNLAEVKQQRENLEQAKKEIDKVALQGDAGKKKAKIAAEILTDNEQEAEEAYDYAVNKFSESVDISNLMKGTRGLLSDIALGTSDLSGFKNTRK